MYTLVINKQYKSSMSELWTPLKNWNFIIRVKYFEKSEIQNSTHPYKNIEFSTLLDTTLDSIIWLQHDHLPIKTYLNYFVSIIVCKYLEGNKRNKHWNGVLVI